MNNLRLLTVLFVAALSGSGVVAAQKTVVTLEEIFASAESGSRELRPSLTAFDEAEREISVARAGKLPDINASLSLSYIADGFTTKRDFSDFQRASIPHLGTGLSVSVNQPVYTGGVVTNSIAIAGLKTTAARYAADLKRDNIRFQLAGMYLDLYKYANIRRVVDANLDAARKVLAEMNDRYEEGKAIRNDITRYELLVANLELELIRIDNTLEIINSNLVATSGLPDGMVVVPDSTILDRSLPVNTENWWQNEAKLNSPVLSMARTGVDISRRTEALARADRLPKIGLHAGWNIDGPILVEIPPINRNLSYWFVGIGVNYNISSLYKSNRTFARSKVATRRSCEQLEAVDEELELAVRADNIRYLEAYEELKSRQKSLELAERNYDTTVTRYSADMALITDLLDAANSRLDAGQQLVNARINIIYCYYKLLFTSGKI